mmetsp:Transcript_38578/g.56700  ORF Transcript_38578/g.56700 Transcript_38578/m.56700 type:complete len:128 (-) Transcript_38578:95-478(-)
MRLASLAVLVVEWFNETHTMSLSRAAGPPHSAHVESMCPDGEKAYAREKVAHVDVYACVTQCACVWLCVLVRVCCTSTRCSPNTIRFRSALSEKKISGSSSSQPNLPCPIPGSCAFITRRTGPALPQ